MQRDSPSEDESSAGSRHNRRRFLKGVGAATVGAVAVTGTASAQQYQFDGCRAVYGDTHADIAVVATDDGFDCRPIAEEVDSEKVPWDWAGYRYEAKPGEVIVGAIEEDVWQGRQLFDRWTCDLELNPSDCAGRFYESEYQIKHELNGNENCGACAGRIISGDGKGVTTVEEQQEADSESDDDDGASFGDHVDSGDDDSAGRTEPTTETATADIDAATTADGGLRSYIKRRFGL